MLKCFCHSVLLAVGFLGLTLFLAPVDPDRPVSNFRYGARQVKTIVDRAAGAMTGQSEEDFFQLELKKNPSAKRGLASLPTPASPIDTSQD